MKQIGQRIMNWMLISTMLSHFHLWAIRDCELSLVKVKVEPTFMFCLCHVQSDFLLSIRNIEWGHPGQNMAEPLSHLACVDHSFLPEAVLTLKLTVLENGALIQSSSTALVVETLSISIASRIANARSWMESDSLVKPLAIQLDVMGSLSAVSWSRAQVSASAAFSSIANTTAFLTMHNGKWHVQLLSAVTCLSFVTTLYILFQQSNNLCVDFQQLLCRCYCPICNSQLLHDAVPADSSSLLAAWWQLPESLLPGLFSSLWGMPQGISSTTACARKAAKKSIASGMSRERSSTDSSRFLNPLVIWSGSITSTYSAKSNMDAISFSQSWQSSAINTSFFTK